MTNGNDFVDGATDGQRLTKREYFAAMALQAVDVQGHVNQPAATNIAQSAVNIADALIKALNAEDEPTMRHAINQADQAIERTPIGEAIRFEEVQEIK